MAGWGDVVGVVSRNQRAQTRLVGRGVPGSTLSFGCLRTSVGSLARCRGHCRLCCLLRSAGLRDVPRKVPGLARSPGLPLLAEQGARPPSCAGADARSPGGLAPNENIITQMEREPHPAP